MRNRYQIVAVFLLAAVMSSHSQAGGPSEKNRKELAARFENCLMRVHYGELDRGRTPVESADRAVELCGADPIATSPHLRTITRKFYKEMAVPTPSVGQRSKKTKPNRLTKFGNCLTRSYYGRIDQIKDQGSAFQEAEYVCATLATSLPAEAVDVVTELVRAQMTSSESETVQ